MPDHQILSMISCRRSSRMEYRIGSTFQVRKADLQRLWGPKSKRMGAKNCTILKVSWKNPELGKEEW